MELKVGGGRYLITKKIGQGAFGDIYHAVNIRAKEEEVAVKLEEVAARVPQLQYEYQLYKLFEGGVGIPKVFYFGQEGDYTVMVMEMLGPTLETLFQFCNRKFSEQTVAMIALQCLDRLEHLHYKNFIHRDIKPENFLIGTRAKDQVIHVIDFGLAKRYRNPTTGTHITFRT